MNTRKGLNPKIRNLPEGALVLFQINCISSSLFHYRII